MSDPAYRLVTAAPSPYGRKVAVALIEKGIAFETTFDLPWADAVETRRYSPLEQLPILLPGAGEPVYDSAMILDWLELAHPDPPLVPAALGDRVACMKLRTLGERLMEIAQSLIFEMHRPAPASAFVVRQSRKIERGLQAAEDLAGERRHLLSPFDQGVIAIATTLLCWEFVVAEGMSPPIEVLAWRERYPELTNLVDDAERRRSFARTRPTSMTVDIGGEMRPRQSSG